MSEIKRMKLFSLCLLLCMMFSCTAEQPLGKKAQHVVFIGMDGWGAYSMPKANMPNVKKLMEEGAYTLSKRTVLPSSSAVNWASMFMGAGPELHGFTTWGSQKPDLPSKELSHYGLFPSIWGLVRDAYPEMEIGYIYEWDGMKHLAEMQAMSWEENPSDSEKTAKAAVKYIKEKKPGYVGIIFAEPDYTGHGAGHDTPEYYAQLKVLDNYVGEIIQAVEDAGMTDETIFVVTSDHGGINKGHGGITMEEMETPFIVSGKGIKKNHEIKQSMMQFDVAATLASIFNVKQPAVWIGRPMDEIFE